MEHLSEQEQQQLSTLLLSADDQNTHLAFEIMKEKPFSEDFITELFVVCKLSNNEEFKQVAQKELERLDANMTKVLGLKSKLSRDRQNGGSGANEKTIAKNIKYYIGCSNGKLDGIKLAKALVTKYGHGYQYLFDTLKGQDLVDYLATFKQGNRYDFSKKGVSKIPKEIFLIEGIKDIEEFDASGNKISTLPTQIGQLTKLKKLYFNSNNLKKVNKNIAKCKQLTYLDLSDNNFKEFPETICACSSLVELRMVNAPSYFTDEFVVPEAFSQLENLETLYFHRERPQHGANLFDVFPNCPNLRVLNLSEYTEKQDQVSQLRKKMPDCTVTLSKILSYLNYN